MIRFRSTVSGVAWMLVLAACASMNAPAKFSDGVLTNNAGMTLYTFDKDTGTGNFDKDTGTGKSVCNGPCAKNWPPLLAAADDKPGGDWSIITRDDGSRQWAYTGKPVYLWIKDQKPGDRTGDGFANNAWHVVKQQAARSEMNASDGGGY